MTEPRKISPALADLIRLLAEIAVEEHLAEQARAAQQQADAEAQHATKPKHRNQK